MNNSAKKIREMTEENMKKEITELKKSIRNQKAQMNAGTPPKNVGKLRKDRRQIARILTIRNENKNKKTKKGGKKRKSK